MNELHHSLYLKIKLSVNAKKSLPFILTRLFPTFLNSSYYMQIKVQFSLASAFQPTPKDLSDIFGIIWLLKSAKIACPTFA